MNKSKKELLRAIVLSENVIQRVLDKPRDKKMLLSLRDVSAILRSSVVRHGGKKFNKVKKIQARNTASEV